MISPDAIIAFLTGVAAVLGGGWSLRRARREERAICDRRVAEIQAAYDRGMDRGVGLTEEHSAD